MLLHHGHAVAAPSRRDARRAHKAAAAAAAADPRLIVYVRVIRQRGLAQRACGHLGHTMGGACADLGP